MFVQRQKASEQQRLRQNVTKWLWKGIKKTTTMIERVHLNWRRVELQSLMKDKHERTERMERAAQEKDMRE